MSKFYVTTPIYYVNANPHIGHAYTQVVADILARYHKMIGDDVFFLTGSDEHGEKIEEASLKAGFERGREKEFVDSIVVNFKKAWAALGIEYDWFIRTTDEGHKATVQEFLNKLKDNGDIYQGEYNGWFCTPCETFWTDTQAGDGVCPDCRRALERIREKNYFFRMSKYHAWLEKHIEDHPEFIMPEFRRNEVTGFLKEGLTDLCISRPKKRSPWGVEIPFDRDYVVYVWMDALINYVSGIKEAGRGFDSLWPADLQIIAKDILRHHAVYWPIMLKSAGMPMPATIFAHGWWKMGEEKMSKSKGNVADPVELARKFGVDPVRYFLIKTVKLGMDGSFSEEALAGTYNSDLANDLGNLLHRTLTMVEKYFGGITPECPSRSGDDAQDERSRDLNARDLMPSLGRWMGEKSLCLKEALDGIMASVGKANKYIEASAPWKFSKEGNMEAIKLIMADLMEVLREAAVGLYPFMPATAESMWRQLGLKNGIADSVDKEEWTGGKKERGVLPRKFPHGTRVVKGEPLFPRIG